MADVEVTTDGRIRVVTHQPAGAAQRRRRTHRRAPRRGVPRVRRATTPSTSRSSPGRAGCSAQARTCSAIAEGNGNRVAHDGDGPMGPTRLRLDKPVLAAIEGFAVAGGLELAVWCDLRVAGEHAVLGVFCRRFGVPLVDLGTIRLPRLIGHSHAMDLILTGRGVAAREAHAMGLVNRVVPDGGALDAALELAEPSARSPSAPSPRPALGARAVGPLRARRRPATRSSHGLEVLRSGESAGRGGTLRRRRGSPRPAPRRSVSARAPPRTRRARSSRRGRARAS